MTANYNYAPATPPTSPPTHVANPDLIFLRDDLADEVGAIVGYLECAREVKDRRLSRRFREIARDEEGHYAQLLQMIASLDPVQAEELSKQELSLLATMGYKPQPMPGMPGMQAMPGMPRVPGMQGLPAGNMSCPTCPQHAKYPAEEDEEEQLKRHYRPFDRDLECLRNALRDELHAINAYQRQIAATHNTAIQNLLTPIMNQEKEHVAEFTKLLLELLSY